MKNPKVIVIGAGASGIAAAVRLLENNITDIIILEAENRIGGRIYSTEFEGNVVDLGAQWCSQKNNIVYNIVKDLDLLSTSANCFDDFMFYYSSGSEITKSITDQLLSIATKIVSDNEALNDVHESFGQYFMDRYNKAVKDNIENLENYRNISIELSEWFQKFILCYKPALTWFDLSAKNNALVKDPDDMLFLNWKDKGFKVFIDVLMKKYPSDVKYQLAIDDKIIFNKEVSKIIWDNNSINNGGVTVECQDGFSYNADHVIVTISLGVLKQNHSKLFSPNLPLQKINAINGLGFGTVNKIFLRFSNPWWPKDSKGFSFLWTDKDRQEVLKEFPCGKCKINDQQSWLESIFGFYPLDNSLNILYGFTVGISALQLEELSNDILLHGCVYLLKRFLGQKYNILQPSDILCSSWNSNSHFCGSYSYKNLKAEEQHISAEHLTEPLIIGSKQKVLFSGEATLSNRYGTVHGAVESGFREADRIINIYLQTLV